jgi:hypothetical protein
VVVLLIVAKYIKDIMMCSTKKYADTQIAELWQLMVNAIKLHVALLIKEKMIIVWVTSDA